MPAPISHPRHPLPSWSTKYQASDSFTPNQLRKLRYFYNIISSTILEPSFISRVSTVTAREVWLLFIVESKNSDFLLLNGSEVWSLILREDHVLRALEKTYWHNIFVVWFGHHQSNVLSPADPFWIHSAFDQTIFSLVCQYFSLQWFSNATYF
jgi:hypothetical protein